MNLFLRPRSAARSAALSAVLLLLVAVTGAAQSLSVSNPIVYPAPTTSDYDAGSSAVYRVTITGGTSGWWGITLRSTSANLGNGKALSHVRFRRPCDGNNSSNTNWKQCDTWRTLSTSDQVVVQDRDINGAFQTVYIEFQVTSWSWSTDTPYNYLANLVFSLTSSGVLNTTSSQLQINVTAIRSITATNTTVTFSSPSTSDFTTGSITSSVTTSITTKANTSHSVVIGANAANLTSTNPLASIPASDLQWSTNASGSWSSWAGLSTTDATVVSRSAGNHTTAFSVQYRTLLNWSRSTNGTHSLTFDYAVQ